jgi:predicted  nucleic acid-binding Zn-ribbon protein
MTMPDRHNILQPIADMLESASVKDVTEATAARDRISNRLNRAESSDSIESFLSHSDVDSGGEDHPGVAMNGVRTEGPIVFVGLSIPSHNSAFCLAGIGGSATKICLNKCPCLTAAHAKSTKIKVAPGFYLRVGSSESSRLAIFADSLGPIELATIREFDFFKGLTGTASDIRNVFAALNRELSQGSSGEDNATSELNRLDLAKITQVPPPMKEVLSPTTGSTSSDAFFAESVAWEDMSLPLLMADFDQMLRTGDDPELSRPFTLNLRSWISQVQSSGTSLADAISELRTMLEKVVDNVDSAVTDLSLRVTSIESTIGKEPDASHNLIGSTVWEAQKNFDESIKFLRSAQTTDRAEFLGFFRENSEDINRLFEHINTLSGKSSADGDYLLKRILKLQEALAESSRSARRSVPHVRPLAAQYGLADAPSSVLHREVAQVDTEALSEMEKKFQAMSERIQVLEAKSSGGSAVKVLNHLFTSPNDVLAFFIKDQASTVSCGGFYDVHFLLSQLYKFMKGVDVPTNQDTIESNDARYQKTLQDLKLTAEDHMMEVSYKSSSSILPEIFSQGKKFSLKSDLPAYPTYQSFNDPVKESGFAQELPRWIETVEPHFQESISQIYAECPAVKAVALEVLSKSVELIRLLIRFVIESVEKLILGGQSKDDVWRLTTKVIKCLFVDLLAKERGLTKFGALDGNRNLRSANFIWGTLKTHRVGCELIVSEIKNHKIVVGTYSSWLVANSGRKEATTALEHSKSLEKKIESLEKKLVDAMSIASAAKKTADKAFNKGG